MAEAQLTGLLRSLSGSLGNFIFRTTKNGIVVADRPSVGPPPSTAEQQFVRTVFTTATKAWKSLTEGQRNAWGQYATTFYTIDKDGVGQGPSGQAVYIKANWYRLASGQTLVSSAPTSAPPASPSNVTNSVAPDENSIVIAITHSVSPISAHRLFVEITPTLASPARHPQPSEYRAVKGLVAASFPALAASAANYTFTAIRFTLNDGDRFGIQATIISPDGIPSLPFTKTLVQSTP